jgi:hypothetical protein
MKGVGQIGTRLRDLADVLCDPLTEVHDPRGFAQAYVEAALLVDRHPNLLRNATVRTTLGKQRLAYLRTMPRVSSAPLPESQRQALREVRSLADTLIGAAGHKDREALARLVAIHRVFRDGTFYRHNIGAKRLALIDRLMEQPYRRRRRKLNRTAQISALGVGEALERVRTTADDLLREDEKGGGLKERAQHVQVIAELVALYPSLLTRPYARRQLGVRRLARLDALFDVAASQT